MYWLQEAAVGPALHLQRELPLLPGVLQQPVRQEVRGMHQAHNQ